jgi:predicted RNA-binding Zn ribbon-like protein
LTGSPDRIGWSWTETYLGAPLGPITTSAVELVTSNRLDRVKQCSGNRCWVLFYDTIKNRSRRWCLMRYCGNAAKSRQQAARRRATRTAQP